MDKWWIFLVTWSAVLLAVAQHSEGEVEDPPARDRVIDAEIDEQWYVAFRAIRNDDVDRLREVLAAGVDVNMRNRQGQTLLHYAIIWKSHDSIVRLLLHHGASQDLWTAAALGDVAAVENLIRHDENSLLTRIGGTSPVHIAAARGRVGVLKVLLDTGVGPSSRNNTVCSTPLHVAAQSGQLEVVRLLIARGADVNAKDCAGQTPLHWATSVEVAKTLVDAGADSRAATDGGATPLDVTVTMGRIDVFNFLMSLGMPKDIRERALAQAVLGASPATRRIMRALLESDLDVNQANAAGHTPLYIAAATGNSWSAEVLLEAGADPNVQTLDQRTPLHEAVIDGNIAMIKLLLRHGASTDIRNDYGLTPLESARSAGRSDIVKILEASRAAR